MIVIGITGVIGSGKTTVCELLKKKGYYVVDCDQIVSRLYMQGNEGYNNIIKSFGIKYVNRDRVNTRKLAQLVFDNEDERIKLNNLIHPLVKKQIMTEIDQIDSALFFIDAPLLFESGLDSICDYIITVTCDSIIRINRIVLRDGCTLQEAEKRISSQNEDEVLFSKSDYVICNNDYNKMNQDLMSVIHEIKKNSKS